MAASEANLSIPADGGAVQSHTQDSATVEVPLRALIAGLTIGCVALLMLGIQPLALGALQAAGRLNVTQMGVAATAELLAIGCISGLLAARCRHRYLKSWTLVGAVLLILANAWGLTASGVMFSMSRGIAGVGAGIIFWVVAGLITRCLNAPRVNAIFLAAMAVSQGVTAALVPIWLTPSFGANASVIVLGATAIAMLPLILLIPRELPFVVSESGSVAGIHVSSILGLTASFFVMAGIVGVWVYVEPIAVAAGIASSVISNSIAASLAAQVVGALLMAAVIRFIPAFAGVIGSAVAYLFVTAELFWGHSTAAFVLATQSFGLLWSVAASMFLPMMIRLDPSRRAALALPGVTLLGCSTGPVAAGLFATDDNIAPAIVTCAAMFALAVCCTVVAYKTRRVAD